MSCPGPDRTSLAPGSAPGDPALLPPAPERAGIGRLFRPALLLGGLLLLGLLLRHLRLGIDDSPVGVDVLRHGLSGRLLFVGLGTLCCAAGLPRQAVCFAAGLAYGALSGTILSELATVAGCAAAYGWARLATPATVVRRFQRPRAVAGLRRLPELARRRPFASVLTLRLLPVGSSLLLNLAAGLLRLPFGIFLLATAIGVLPQTVVFVLLGGGARIGEGWQTAAAVALFAASGIGGLVLLRQSGQEVG